MHDSVKEGKGVWKPNDHDYRDALNNTCQVKKGCHEAVVGTLVEGAFHRSEEVLRLLLPFPAEVLAKFNAGFLLVMWAFRVRMFFAFFIFKADDVVFLWQIMR